MKITTLLFLSFMALVGHAHSHSNSGLAVLLIDMQEGFYQRGGTTNSNGLRDLVRNQQKLLKWATKNHIPVMIFEYEGFGKTDPKLTDLLTGHTSKIIEKNEDGGFHGKSRNEAISTMREWNVDSIIVAGINGPYCVKDSIVGALESGFNVMTTLYVIGNINVNPPIFPSGVWTFRDRKFTVFPSLESIIY